MTHDSDLPLYYDNGEIHDDPYREIEKLHIKLRDCSERHRNLWNALEDSIEWIIDLTETWRSGFHPRTYERAKIDMLLTVLWGGNINNMWEKKRKEIRNRRKSTDEYEEERKKTIVKDIFFMYAHAMSREQKLELISRLSEELDAPNDATR